MEACSCDYVDLFQFIANLAIFIEFGVVLVCIVVKPSSVDSALVTWQCCYSHIYTYIYTIYIYMK